jgi:hypothetical protein
MTENGEPLTISPSTMKAFLVTGTHSTVGRQNDKKSTTDKLLSLDENTTTYAFTYPTSPPPGAADSDADKVVQQGGFVQCSLHKRLNSPRRADLIPLLQQADAQPQLQLQLTPETSFRSRLRRGFPFRPSITIPPSPSPSPSPSQISNPTRKRKIKRYFYDRGNLPSYYDANR